MGNCDSTNNANKKFNPKTAPQASPIEPKNVGKPYYSAPIDDTNGIKYQPNIITSLKMSTSQNMDCNNTKLVKYCPKYLQNSQRSVLQASLVELGKNSIMANPARNSTFQRSGITSSLSSIGEDSEVEIIQGGEIRMSALDKDNGKIDPDNYNQYVQKKN